MSQPTPPPYTLEPGTEFVELPMQIASGRSLTSGLQGPERMRIRMAKRTNDGHLIGRAWFAEGADGPPRHVHGGAVAYVLDEAMGAVGWMNDYPIVAAKLEFEYFKMSPLHVDFVIEARITSATAKRVFVEAEMRLPDGDVCVRGKGEFAILTQKKIDALDASKFDPKALLKNPRLKWAKDDAR